MTSVCIAQVAPRGGPSTACRPFSAEKVLQGLHMTPNSKPHAVSCTELVNTCSGFVDIVGSHRCCYHDLS